MRQKDLRSTLTKLDSQGIWAFYHQTLQLLFTDKPKALSKGLQAAVRDGLLVRVGDGTGLYANPAARSMPSDPLTHLVDMIRPCCLNYLSLESVASEAGLVSQIPGRYTVMSTGKSGVITTPFGTVEFVRTRRTREGAGDGLTFDEERGLLVASPEIALRDLRRTGRSADLIA